MRCALDTRTKKFPYTIIFKLIPKFKLLHQSEVTVCPGTLLLRVRVKFSLGVRVSGMIRVRVDVRVRVRVSNLLGSD